MTELISIFHTTPMIAAVREHSQLLRAIASPVRVVFLLGGDPFTLPESVALAKKAGKLVFVHMDFIEGISRDAAGVRWVSRVIQPTGVLSTRPPLLRAAGEEGLQTVLRIFLVDSSSLETGVRMVNACDPDFVEVMPGVVTKAIEMLGKRITPPIIAGGMLEQEKDIRAALAAGAIASSSSCEALWRKEDFHG